MKPIIVLLTTLLLNMSATATIITVDNHYPSMGDYNNLQAAQNAANNFDTLLLTPSLVGYPSTNILKPLTIIGNGYGDGTSTTLPHCIIYNPFGIDPNAAGGKICSVEINGRIDIYATNFTIERCKTGQIQLFGGSSNVLLHQNLIIAGFSIQYYNQSDATLLNNCILSDNYFCLVNGSQITNASITALNNIFINKQNGAFKAIELSNTNSYFANNIISPQQSGIISSFNNIISDGSLPSTNGNQLNVDLNTVFMDYANGNYHLKPGSPAIGAGLNGVDIGIYGGSTPFIDGGLPPLPSIYYLDVPINGSTQNGVNVTIKAKSNN